MKEFVIITCISSVRSNMKKIIIAILSLAVVGIGVYFLFFNKSTQSENSMESVTLTSPQRPAEINGLIVSALGNEIKVANEVGKVILSEEEQAANKAAMQSMSQEERAAAREEAKIDLTTEDISLIIPVGVPIVKGSGDASGSLIGVDIADLLKGVYVSIWTDDQGKVEFVKIKGV